MRAKVIVLFVMVMAWALTGCESDTGAGGAAGGSSRCDPGDTKACACTNGGQGTKTCDADKKWEACSCAGGQDASGGDSATGDTMACEPQCDGRDCGPDSCGGLCGTCAEGSYCGPELTCVEGECTPQCEGMACGYDGCGGMCGVCGDGEACANGICVPVVVTGCDPACESGYQCVDDTCVPVSTGCDPACPEGTVCDSGICVPISDDCAPPCGSGEICMDGECVPDSCAPACGDKMCGDDGCGGSCGECGSGMKCQGFQCVPEGDCPCPDVQCGFDGCGGTCGGCTQSVCMDGACMSAVDCPTAVACAMTCVANMYDEDSGLDCIFSLCSPEGVFDGGSSYLQLVMCVADACKSWPDDPSCYEWAPVEMCPSEYEACYSGGSCTPYCQDSWECGDDGCGGGCGPLGGQCPAGMNCNPSQHICEPGSGDECNGITFEGCCDGEVLKYCENGALTQGDCSSQPSCGWEPSGGYYNCGTDGGEDPSGANPKACPSAP